MSDSFVTPWTVAHQAPLFTGFPRQEYWSGLPFPPPEDLPNPGIKPESCVSCIYPEPPGKAFMKNNCFQKNVGELYILPISLLSGLIENSWILSSASPFNLLQSVALVEVDKANPAYTDKWFKTGGEF